MDSHAVVSRFEAERQTLAMMDHPCVARVYDAGTTENWTGLAPGPNFTWSPQNPEAAESVTFTTSSPGPWSWVFPGGVPPQSAEQNPEVLFFLSGEKAVSLTTSNRRQKVVNVVVE